MEGDKEYPVGTLFKDMRRYGVVTKVIKSGALETNTALINWRVNYELIYFDGEITIIGKEAFERLITAGIIKIL